MKLVYKLSFSFLLVVFFIPQNVSAEILFDTITPWRENINYAVNGEYSNSNLYKYVGSAFSTSTSMGVGSISLVVTAQENESETVLNEVQLFIFKGSLSIERDEWQLLDVSLSEKIYVTFEEQQEVKFRFPQGVFLQANEQYIFEVTPLSFDYNYSYLLWGSNAIPYSNYLYHYFLQPEETFFNTQTPVAIKIESIIEDFETEKINLTLPCETDNTQEQPCIVGYASTSLLEVEGTSINMQSWYTGTYDVYVGLFDVNNFLLDFRTITDFTPNDNLNFFTTLEWDNPTGDLAYLKVCQVPSDGTGPFNYDECAQAILGYDLTTASTTALVEFWNLDRQVPVDKTTVWQENGCDDIGLTEIFKGVKCALIYSFSPSTQSLNRFANTRQMLLTIYPIGYGTIMLQDIYTTFSTTSTDVFDNDIPVKELFGMEGGTTTIDMESMLSKTGFLNDVFDFIEIFLWLIFAGWLLMYSLTRKL